MMVPAGGGGAARSSSKSKGKKGKKGSESNTGLIIGLSAGIGGVAILGAVILFVVMGRGGDDGDSVASNSRGNSGSSSSSSNDNASSSSENDNASSNNNAQSSNTANNNSANPSTPTGGHGGSSAAHGSQIPTAAPEQLASGQQPTVDNANATNGETQPLPDNTIAANTQTPLVDASGLPAVPDAPMDLVALTRFVQPGVVRLEVETEFGGGLGSGFVVNKQGVIVTNYHVIAGAVNARAFFETEGEGVPVTGVWHLDPERDIAILQIDCPPEQLFPVNIATELPAQGLDVAAFGAPHGLSFTVTRGIVSAIRNGSEIDHSGTLVQHDVSINPGNSGGPLVTFRGEVVAINTFLLRNSQNLNFAISCVDIRDCLSKMLPEMLAVNPTNIPSQEGEIAGAIDYTDTEKGDAMLGRIRDLDVVTLNLAEDPSGVIKNYIEETAERLIERADIDTNQLDIYDITEIDFRNPVMIVIYHFATPETEDDDDPVAYLDVMVHMQVVMVNVNEDGKEEICIVWEREEERIGSVALLGLARGQLPNSIEEGVREFFGQFVSRCRNARN